MSGRDGPGRVGQSRTTLGEDFRLINNRQNGRRRGRGGSGTGRPPSNHPGPGNRQDNRQRGNAAQLLEKYKGLARDAQMQGDRVLTENYLQFADHYFRVLGESRPRFEEQRPRQRDDYNDDDDYQDNEGREAGDGDDGDDDGRDEPRRDQRPERAPRQDREVRADREPRQDREVRADREPRQDRDARPEPRQDRDSRPDREPRPERAERDVRPDRDSRPERAPRAERDNDEYRAAAPVKRPRARRPEAEAGEGGGERIALDVLPPAISAANEGAEPVAPRRRVRRPRAPDEDIAPAA
jgi:hypothetical protein